ncbi:MAG: hypothetical protein K2Y05_11065, partial [Hyphomicrobiaceae bacterium]|nr:hypothetical protein [Hyphomicrobiaceae bacterium]
WHISCALAVHGRAVCRSPGVDEPICPTAGRGSDFDSDAADRQLGLAEPRLGAGMGVKSTDTPSKFGGDSWARAYAGLVEANIAAVSGLVGTAERDRELGELLSGFASNPFEVEL